MNKEVLKLRQAAFEAWYKKHYTDYIPMWEGQYANLDTRLAWESWQMATDVAIEEAAKTPSEEAWREEFKSLLESYVSSRVDFVVYKSDGSQPEDGLRPLNECLTELMCHVDRMVATVRDATIEEAAVAATSFLIGDPFNGIPLHSPSPHEIAKHIRSLGPVVTNFEEQSESTNVPFEPTEDMYGGLARTILLGWDCKCDTPRKLFQHLEMSGREIPQWLHDESEMKNLDHVPSKGTRISIIWKAMYSDFNGDSQ